MKNRHSHHDDGGFWLILDGGERMMTLLLLGVGVFLLYILGSLVVPVLLAAILAAVTWGPRNALVRRLRGRTILASLILDAILVLGLLVPLALITIMAAFQVRDLLQSQYPAAFQAWLLQAIAGMQDHRWLSNLGVQPEELMGYLKEAAPKLARLLLGWVAQFTIGLARSTAFGAIMLLCLFYFHLAGDRFVVRIRRVLPLPKGETLALLEVFRRTALAILKGNFVVAGVQGTMTGILFALVGLPSPVLFGVLAALCSLVPSVGSALVWVPGAVALAAFGSWGAALVVVLTGGLVISLVDNVLRPVLVGRDTGMHDLMVLLTTLGGLTYFGPLGLLFGPLVGSIFLALLERHEERLRPHREGAEASKEGGDSVISDPVDLPEADESNSPSRS